MKQHFTSLHTEVKQGSCFVAIRGNSVDGHDYIAKAIAQGASKIVAEQKNQEHKDVEYRIVSDSRCAFAEMSAEYFASPSRQMKLVGITGTNGKTTITYLLESIFAMVGLAPGVIGTVQHRYENVCEQAKNTTPDAFNLQRLLRAMSDAGVKACAMEVSSHALEQQRVHACQFDAALFTNLTPEHLDYHDNLQSYYQAKEKLFSKLLAESEKANKFAAINLDDEHGKKLALALSDKCFPILSFSLKTAADVRGEIVEMGLQGLKLKITFKDKSFELNSALLGKFNAENILAAVTIALGFSFKQELICQAIAKVSQIPGRFELVPNNSGITAIVDYAHTPDALQNVLSHARVFAKDRLIVVFGCGGDRDTAKRPVMGKIAASLADVVIVTSDNPRSEDPRKIIDEISRDLKADAQSFNGSTGYEIITNRQAAIVRALKIATADDCVVVAGKGHEDYQIIGNDVSHFDDKAEIKKALAC